MRRPDGTERRSDVLDALQLPGRHNVANALAAIAGAGAVAIDLDAVRRALEEFRGLPHRLERIATCHGRIFYNDSIATTPRAACAALEAFDAPVVLIAGGRGKGLDLEPLVQLAARRCRAVALIGETAEELHSLLGASDDGSRLPFAVLGDLTAAVRWAWQQSQSGDVILLSPACASYDQFRNFVDRGEAFRQDVEELLQWLRGAGRVAVRAS